MAERDDKQDHGCTCHGCGALFKIDVLLPDDVWASISPKPVEGFGGGGLLCPACIFQRLGKLFDFAAWRLVGVTPSAVAITECPDGQKCSQQPTGQCWGRCVRADYIRSHEGNSGQWKEIAESYRRTANELAERVAKAEAELESIRSATGKSE